jgi:hypothetical protein
MSARTPVAGELTVSMVESCLSLDHRLSLDRKRIRKIPEAIRLHRFDDGKLSFM